MSVQTPLQRSSVGRHATLVVQSRSGPHTWPAPQPVESPGVGQENCGGTVMLHAVEARAAARSVGGRFIGALRQNCQKATVPTAKASVTPMRMLETDCSVLIWFFSPVLSA